MRINRNAAVLCAICSLSAFSQLRAQCAPIPAEPAQHLPAVVIRDSYQRRLEIINCHINAHHARRAKAVKTFNEKVLSKGAKKKGFEQALLAETHANLTAVSRITKDYAHKLNQVKPEYTQLIQRYSTESQPAVETTDRQLLQIVELANTEDVKTLGELSQRLVMLQQAEASRLSECILLTNRLLGALSAVDQEYESKMLPYSSFMTGKKLARANGAQEPTNALLQMRGACQERALLFTEKTQSVLRALQKKEEVLIARKADKHTKKVMVQVRHAEASAQFLREINTLASEADYMTKQKFISYADICAVAQDKRPAWAFTGCQVLSTDYDRVLSQTAMEQ